MKTVVFLHIESFYLRYSGIFVAVLIVSIIAVLIGPVAAVAIADAL